MCCNRPVGYSCWYYCCASHAVVLMFVWAFFPHPFLVNSAVAFFPVPAHLATNHHLTDGIIHVQHYAVGILEDCLGACLQWLKMPPHRPLHIDTTTVALIMHNWHVMAVDDWEVSTIVNENIFPLYILMNLNHINTWQEMTNKDVSVKYFKIFCLFYLSCCVKGVQCGLMSQWSSLQVSCWEYPELRC